jgi:folate-binding protein YgfZ
MSGVDEQVRAFLRGEGFARLRGRRIVLVGGSDAVGWLQDLLSADVAALPVGGAGPSYLLTPTGRIRAAVWVLRRATQIALVQAEGAGRPIDALLAPYALTSDVTLTVAEDLEVIAVPAGHAEAEVFSPSAVGAHVDALVTTGHALDGLVDALSSAHLIESGDDALERVRVLRGVPRMGADFGESSLPAEVGDEDAVAAHKGCFLGQESVARVRNLGHPPTVLRRVRADGGLPSGQEVLADGRPAGIVTSAAPDGAGSVALIRTAWAHRASILTTPDGRTLHPVTATA